MRTTNLRKSSIKASAGQMRALRFKKPQQELDTLSQELPQK